MGALLNLLQQIFTLMSGEGGALAGGLGFVRAFLSLGKVPGFGSPVLFTINIPLPVGGTISGSVALPATGYIQTMLATVTNAAAGTARVDSLVYQGVPWQTHQGPGAPDSQIFSVLPMIREGYASWPTGTVNDRIDYTATNNGPVAGNIALVIAMYRRDC